MRSGSVAPNSGTPRRKRTLAQKGLPVSSALVEQFGLTRHHPRLQRFFVFPEWPYQQDKVGYSRCAIIHWYEVANTRDGMVHRHVRRAPPSTTTVWPVIYT